MKKNDNFDILAVWLGQCVMVAEIRRFSQTGVDFLKKAMYYRPPKPSLSI
jgi:hypothetical protein